MSSEFRDHLIELRLTRAYIQLLIVPADGHGARTVSLARFGKYEVRLSEFVQDDRADAEPMWLELYARDTQTSVDSCSCADLEDAVRAAKDLICQAKRNNGLH